MNLLPVRLAHALEPESSNERWLVDRLWGEAAVGIVGGEPKCCKSFLALELAVAVASGRPCLGRYRVERSGPVLLFAAEDSTRIVRARLEGIATARGERLEDLQIHVIVAATVRLDQSADRERLWNTVASIRPRLLILDPFVRLHRIDENASGDVAPLLAFLRELNREHKVAVIVVHHAKKGGGSQRAGQTLRGSSEFHAWGDSNLYLARRASALMMQVEHRAAPSIEDLRLELRSDTRTNAPALEIVVGESTVESTGSTEERIIAVLHDEARGLRVAELRSRTRMRMQTLVEALRRLVEAGRVLRDDDGVRLAD
ncbi:MAG: AAA family ATPase [Polyangiaceae bacterium]